MHDLFIPASIITYHRRGIARRKNAMAQQIWSLRFIDLPSIATGAFYIQTLDLELLLAPSLCCLCTASPARGAPVRPRILEKETRGWGSER
jgi:hypothetical protein